MALGVTNNALLLGLAAMVDRTFQARLHYGNPGENGTENVIGEVHGYEHVVLPRGAITREGSEGAVYSNTNAVTWPVASGGTWGQDAVTPKPVEYITLWYDASNQDNANAAEFDTLFCVFKLRVARRVDDGELFILRPRAMDVVSTFSQ